MAVIEVRQGDITQLEVDAIVNAANQRMLGGGGVDGAIHRAAGPRLLEACRKIPTTSADVRCPTGECRVTPGFDLPATYVIHTVGPVWRGGDSGEPGLLSACYRNSIWLATCLGARSIAFPAISCGVYGYPLDLAATLSVATLTDSLSQHTPIDSVLLVAFDESTMSAWETALAAR